MAESKEPDTNADAWLQDMIRFCTELQSFLSTEVPEDANIRDYASGASALHNILEDNKDRYPTLYNEEFSMQKSNYMQGITGNESATRRVHKLGMQTCNLVNKHPVFGVFQADPETRVQPFFEKQLNICMALGVEHDFRE